MSRNLLNLAAVSEATVTGYITRERNDGTWYLRVELPRANDGRRKQRRETVRGTKADAQKRLRIVLRELETNGAADTKIAFADLCARWLEATTHRVGIKTLRRYESITRIYLIPSLGHLRAESLSPSQIESALSSWINGPRNDRESGKLSPRTVKHLLDTLRTICRWAVKMRVLTRNPVDSVEPPLVPRKEMRALDADGVGTLLQHASSTDLEAPISVAVGTGLRRGELLALRWTDIDLERSRLTVRRSLETVDGITRSKPPKTARSARTIALPQFVREVLRRVRREQNERRLALGLGRLEDGWVFSLDGEQPIEPGAFSFKFAQIVKRSNIQHVRFHDLRHSFGTLALASGVDLKTVSSALGHSTIAMTANTYVHAVEALQDDAAARIDGLLGHVVTGARTTLL